MPPVTEVRHFNPPIVGLAAQIHHGPPFEHFGRRQGREAIGGEMNTMEFGKRVLSERDHQLEDAIDYIQDENFYNTRFSRS